MPTGTSIVLFNRDLRVHDHLALGSAVRESAQVIPLFVFDERLTSSEHASPNRFELLIHSIGDLRDSLRSLGGDLVVRRGDPVREMLSLAQATGASTVWASADISPFARRREAVLREACQAVGVDVQLMPGVTVVSPDELHTSAGTPFRVFTPYWRRWTAAERRRVEPVPQRVSLPDGVSAGRIPSTSELLAGATSPRLPESGEAAARAQLAVLLARGRSPDAQAEETSIEHSSRLGPALHFGCLSPLELDLALGAAAGHEALRRSLCWRDFYCQLTAHHPRATQTDFRPRKWAWARDPDLERAWKEGMTGYPFVDAAMRQLREEGWMHNRLRMLVASFLTKHMGIDWRVGAAHFNRWLTDGDVASNTANWQWVAGTGTDTRPNRILNPVRQAKRFDPKGSYTRRFVRELETIGDDAIHEPWKLDAPDLRRLGYPERVIDHEVSAAAFKERILESKARRVTPSRAAH